MYRRRARHPLGGGRNLRRHVTGASGDSDTARSLKEIRGTLLAARLPSVGHVDRPDRRTDRPPMGRLVTEGSGLFRNAPFGVDHRRLGPGSRTKSRLEALRSTTCNRWELDSELAHACDVLGPSTCSDCIRERMRRQIYDDADRTFPGISVSERDLCAACCTSAVLDVRPSRRLPAIREAEVADRKRPQIGAGRTKTTIRDSRSLQEIRRRAARRGLLPMTGTELQDRVLRRHGRNEPTAPTGRHASDLYSPADVSDDGEMTLALTPTIRVEIKFPAINQNTEDPGSKLSP